MPSSPPVIPMLTNLTSSPRNPSCVQEADIDEDSEQNLVVDWDQDAADTAYKRVVEEAQREEEERVAAELRWQEVCLGRGVSCCLVLFI